MHMFVLDRPIQRFDLDLVRLEHRLALACPQDSPNPSRIRACFEAPWRDHRCKRSQGL